MEFLDKIQKILGRHEPSEVDELILDELFIIDEFNEDQRNSLEQYDSLLHLSLNKIGLKSLKNLPRISCLQILELRENKLDMHDISEILTIYPRLIKLKIGGNPITNIDNLNVLSTMGELRNIEIKNISHFTSNNEAQELEKLFSMLKNVEVINNKNRENQLIESSVHEEEESVEFDDDENEEEEYNEELDEDFEEEIDSVDDSDLEENEEPKNKKKK